MITQYLHNTCDRLDLLKETENNRSVLGLLAPASSSHQQNITNDSGFEWWRPILKQSTLWSVCNVPRSSMANYLTCTCRSHGLTQPTEHRSTLRGTFDKVRDQFVSRWLFFVIFVAILNFHDSICLELINELMC